ncbi:uncharacterized protein LOC119487946 isoform X3 [Sebastes umbrosus]|uniref:uncharacterized protein LOC119487946 isoform X3 n=1 Tax=Sebastes umbrosus TaxID=72105 RepID=UPI00189C7EA2|nr:uncharacterized protein LOC119487946 isoform X3 [Sebastes umbrosus]
MLGPYKIIELEGKIAVLATSKGKGKLQTNIDLLTHYFQPEERIPAKLKKLSDPSPLAGPQQTHTQTLIHSTQTPTSEVIPKPSEAPSMDCKAQRPSSDPEILIRDIWTGRRRETLWSKIGPYKIYSENLMVLAPGEQLEGEVAAGAVCHNGHWTLIIMYLKEMRALFLDPFGATDEQIQKCKDVTRTLVRQKCPAVGRWACTTVGHPKQQDAVSCGVFVCKLAEQILLKEAIQYPVDHEGVAILRLNIAISLLNNSDDLSQLCRACGELSSGADIDDWVRRLIHILANDWDAPWIGYLNITG